MLAMPWIATGVFVYQSFITDSKMWNIYTIPKAFMVYSIASIITLFFSGFLVDKFTSRKLIPMMNIPLNPSAFFPKSQTGVLVKVIMYYKLINIILQ